MGKNCNCENCGCDKFVDTTFNQSAIMPIIDNMGREIFWEDMGRKDE